VVYRLIKETFKCLFHTAVKERKKKKVNTNVLLTESSCFIKFYSQRNEAHSTLIIQYNCIKQHVLNLPVIYKEM
jgi:hypothetical protein